jgi:iron complex outermembrane receptor protein
MSKRYYTYSNDASVPSRSILNGVVGYKMGQTAGMSDAVLQLSIANITDQKYISTIGSNGFSYSDAQGTSQTILPGAPRAFFLSLNGKL